MSAENVRRIEVLHTLYCEHTGRKVPLEAWRQNEWARWLLAIEPMGIPAEKAVVMVAERIKWLIRKGEIWGSALSFSRFVMRPDEFQEHLAAALAEGRKPVQSPELKVVEAFTGRPMEPKQAEAVSAAVVLERTKLSEQLREWANKNL